MRKLTITAAVILGMSAAALAQLAREPADRAVPTNNSADVAPLDTVMSNITPEPSIDMPAPEPAPAGAPDAASDAPPKN